MVEKDTERRRFCPKGRSKSSPLEENGRSGCSERTTEDIAFITIVNMVGSNRDLWPISSILFYSPRYMSYEIFSFSWISHAKKIPLINLHVLGCLK